MKGLLCFLSPNWRVVSSHNFIQLCDGSKVTAYIEENDNGEQRAFIARQYGKEYMDYHYIMGVIKRGEK